MKRRWIVAIVALTLLSGCGDPDLWARWQAQRGLWRANRAADVLMLRPGRLDPTEWTRLETGFRSISDAYPAGRWAGRAMNPGPARDVALASSQASLVLGELAARAGHDELAVERWRSAAKD